MHGRDPPKNPNAPITQHQSEVEQVSADGVTLYTANLGDCRAILCRNGRGELWPQYIRAALF